VAGLHRRVCRDQRARLDELVEKFKADHDDYNAIMAEALADRLAEAFAEYLHKRVREEWGFGRSENLTTEI
jgi:5-methyltetrahydrofolate--homocysteine methyltransferase